MPFFRPGRRGAIHMTIVRHQIESFQCRVGWIAAMDGLTLIADDHVSHQPPDDVVENRDSEQREAVGPRNEDRSDDDDGDPSLAIEILLKVELIVSARRAAFNQRAGRRCNHGIGGSAAVTRARRLTRFARLTRVAFRAEEMD